MENVFMLKNVFFKNIFIAKYLLYHKIFQIQINNQQFTNRIIKA